MKLNKKIILVVIVIIILSTIFIWFKLINKQNETIEIENTKIDPTSNTIIELLSYIPFSTLFVNEYYDAYRGNIILNKDTLQVILSLINNNNDNYNEMFKDILKKNNIEYANVYLTNDISSFLNKRYNLKLEDINNISGIMIINLDNEYTAIKVDYSKDISYIIKTMISVPDAYWIKDGAIIEEKVLFFQIIDSGYNVYNSSNISSENLIKFYDKIDENGKELSYLDIFNKIRNDFQDYNYVFKHTYKKNKTGYYWYSTEFIEEE